MNKENLIEENLTTGDIKSRKIECSFLYKILMK